MKLKGQTIPDTEIFICRNEACGLYHKPIPAPGLGIIWETLGRAPQCKSCKQPIQWLCRKESIEKILPTLTDRRQPPTARATSESVAIQEKENERTKSE
jgi:hypothetical protein